MIKTQILICDDDPLFHMAVKETLKGTYDCKSAYNGDEAKLILKNYPINVMLLDIQMRSGDEGLRYIPIFKETNPDISIIMSSGLTDFNTVREAMRLGANDYIPKDFIPDELKHVLFLVLEKQKLIKQKDQQNFEVTHAQNKHVLIGESKGIIELKRTIDRIRKSPANVVITGETGTGKEVVARQLRGTLSDGSLAPFVAVDSATIQSSTAESILFGHEKGAFTGAEKRTKGVFEEANGGIVYFDEVANMPLNIQAKLLRVLQEKEVVRLGSTYPVQLEFRVICATNKNLETLVKTGEFKDDLLQRLNVLPIELPPLRERKEDIPLLVDHFAKLHSSSEQRVAFNSEALEALQKYPWPGNIRELSNLVAYVIAMAEDPEIELADLPPKFREAFFTTTATFLNKNGTFIAELENNIGSKISAESGLNFYQQVEAFEKDILSQYYQKEDGNISQLALRLEMDRSHLYAKLKNYGIHAKKK